MEEREDCGTTAHMLEINYIIINLRIHFLGSLVCAIYETHFSCLYSEGCDGAGEAFPGECHRNTAPALGWLQTCLTRMVEKKKKTKIR